MSAAPEPTPFRYSVFGLRLGTDRSIEALAPLLSDAGAAIDVRIHFGNLPPWANRDRTTLGEPSYVSPVVDNCGRPAATAWNLSERYLWLTYTGRMDFLVDRRGTEAWVVLPAPSAFGEAVSYLMGPLLGLILRLRGTTCLHASAIAAGGRAVAFAGPQGAGKSTLAAALGLRGYPVMSDDLVALCGQAGTVVAQPGYARLSLRPQVTGGLQEMSSQPLAFEPDWDEHVTLDVTASGYLFQQHPLPVAAIYCLDSPSAGASLPAVGPMSGPDALMRLVGDTWAARLLDRSQRAAEFDLMSRLLAQAPVRAVRPHVDPARLAELCDLVARDLESLP